MRLLIHMLKVLREKDEPSNEIIISQLSVQLEQRFSAPKKRSFENTGSESCQDQIIVNNKPVLGRAKRYCQIIIASSSWH